LCSAHPQPTAVPGAGRATTHTGYDAGDSDRADGNEADEREGGCYGDREDSNAAQQRDTAHDCTPHGPRAHAWGRGTGAEPDSMVRHGKHPARGRPRPACGGRTGSEDLRRGHVRGSSSPGPEHCAPRPWACPARLCAHSGRGGAAGPARHGDQRDAPHHAGHRPARGHRVHSQPDHVDHCPPRVRLSARHDDRRMEGEDARGAGLVRSRERRRTAQESA